MCRGNHLSDVVVDDHACFVAVDQPEYAARFYGSLAIRTSAANDGTPAALDLETEFHPMEVANGMGELAVTADGIVVSVSDGKSPWGDLEYKFGGGGTILVAKMLFTDMDWITLSADRKERTIAFVSMVPWGEIVFVADGARNEANDRAKAKTARPLMTTSVALACAAVGALGDSKSDQPHFGEPNPRLEDVAKGQWYHDQEAHEQVAFLHVQDEDAAPRGARARALQFRAIAAR